MQVNLETLNQCLGAADPEPPKPSGEPSSNPPPEMKFLSELVAHTGDDPGELLKHRFLCAGGGLLIVGPTGVGKSAFGMQCAIHWALGLPCFDIRPARPLTSLIIQAENDSGDLAEMRDGVIRGLTIAPADARRACETIVVCREDARTGASFFTETVEPLLASQRPDLLWIDPALSYIGGDSNSQRDVGGFLRNYLNPLLRRYNCGGIVIHHTNKPLSGKEKSTWGGNDFAYLGGGSAEWANWARAVIAIRGVGSNDAFELRLGKRGGRVGWKAADGQEKSYAKIIGHSTEPGVICWRELDESEAPKTAGAPKKYNAEMLLDVLGDGELTAKEWEDGCNSEKGIGRTRFFELKAELEKSKQVFKSKITGKWNRKP